jgi:hypothetical protein
MPVRWGKGRFLGRPGWKERNGPVSKVLSILGFRRQSRRRLPAPFFRLTEPRSQ